MHLSLQDCIFIKHRQAGDAVVLLVYGGNNIWVLGTVKYKMRESIKKILLRPLGGGLTTLSWCDRSAHTLWM